MKHPRIVLLTSNELRHRYVARELSRHLAVVGILTEAKAPRAGQVEVVSPADQQTLAKHYAGRDEAERRWLGTEIEFPPAEVNSVAHGGSNTPAVFEWVKSLNPDYVLLYGTSIIKPPLLSEYEGRMVNMHLGLSPYYRGTATNFWPLVNREPECVGATIHLAVLKVDAGAILAQVRPQYAADDNVHDLGTKTIIAGAAAFPAVLDAYSQGSIGPRQQDLSGGRVYRRKDFDAEAVRQMWRQFESGMIPEFLAARDARLARFPIIETP